MGKSEINPLPNSYKSTAFGESAGVAGAVGEERAVAGRQLSAPRAQGLQEQPAVATVSREPHGAAGRAAAVFCWWFLLSGCKRALQKPLPLRRAAARLRSGSVPPRTHVQGGECRFYPGCIVFCSLGGLVTIQQLPAGFYTREKGICVTFRTFFLSNLLPTSVKPFLKAAFDFSGCVVTVFAVLGLC